MYIYKAQELLAGAEAGVAMGDAILAARKIELARRQFQMAYKGEEMLLDVELQLAALQVSLYLHISICIYTYV